MRNQHQPNRQEYTRPKLDTKMSWKTIFLAHSGGFSSKRVCGVIGWLVCIILLIAGFILEKPISEFADYVLITSASLLGVDSLTGVFSKGNRN